MSSVGNAMEWRVLLDDEDSVDVDVSEGVDAGAVGLDTDGCPDRCMFHRCVTSCLLS